MYCTSWTQQHNSERRTQNNTRTHTLTCFPPHIHTCMHTHIHTNIPIKFIVLEILILHHWWHLQVNKLKTHPWENRVMQHWCHLYVNKFKTVSERTELCSNDVICMWTSSNHRRENRFRQHWWLICKQAQNHQWEKTFRQHWWHS